jgi:hypothetical protein
MPRLLDYLSPVYAWLAAINPAAPKVAFVALVFLIVMAWRRWFPSSWVAYSGAVAKLLGITDEDTSKFKELLMHALQGIPAAVIGGVLAVLGTGGDIQASISLALVALFAPLGHFLMSRYKGKLGTPSGKLPPASPKKDEPDPVHVVFPQDKDGRPLELRGLALALLAFALLGCSGAQPAPGCTDLDFAAESRKCVEAQLSCKANGGSLEECETACDGTAAAWQDRCSR